MLLIDAKYLSIVSTVTLLYETLRNHALLSIILYIINIANLQNCLLSNKQYTARKTDPKIIYGTAIVPLIELLDGCCRV